MGYFLHVLFHPDYTVGSGISPDLLTSQVALKALAGSGQARYRRWGISPRPENSYNIELKLQKLQGRFSHYSVG